MDDQRDDLPPESTDSETRAKEEGGFGHRVIPDIVRRALMTGVGTVLLGQEGVRTAIGDMKLPKEAMDYLVSQADRTKREVIHSMARELRQFLDGLELQDLIQRSLVGTTFEIHTTVRVVQNDAGEIGATVLEKSSKVTHDAPADDEDVARAASGTGRKKKARSRRGRSADG